MDAIRGRKRAGLRAALKADPPSRRHAGAIVEAARAAFLPGLELLHHHEADLNAIWKNYRPLHALMQDKPHRHAPAAPERLACLDWLLERGADPQLAAGWPPARAILIAAFVGEGSYVSRLRQGARADSFVAAALGGRQAVAKRIRPAGVCPRLRRRRPDGPALRCIAPRTTLPLRTLVARGADATEALVHAAWGPGEKFCEVCLAHGALPHRAVSDGKPLLNHLIAWGQITPALSLLAHGASPNQADARGWTAVHQAAARGNTRLMEAVLQAGGDLTRRDLEGHTPRDVSRKK